jgi:cell division protein FtsW (lipid II flippase)
MTENRLKIIRFTLGAMMLVFAGLQLNDPDPIPWVMAYVVVASLIVVDGIRTRKYLLLLGVAYLFFAIWLFPSEYYGVGNMQENIPEIEEARESLGILIAGGICLLGYWLGNCEQRVRGQHEQ